MAKLCTMCCIVSVAALHNRLDCRKKVCFLSNLHVTCRAGPCHSAWPSSELSNLHWKYKYSPNPCLCPWFVLQGHCNEGRHSWQHKHSPAGD